MAPASKRPLTPKKRVLPIKCTCKGMYNMIFYNYKKEKTDTHLIHVIMREGKTYKSLRDIVDILNETLEMNLTVRTLTQGTGHYVLQKDRVTANLPCQNTASGYKGTVFVNDIGVHDTLVKYLNASNSTIQNRNNATIENIKKVRINANTIVQMLVKQDTLFQIREGVDPRSIPTEQDIRIGRRTRSSTNASKNNSHPVATEKPATYQHPIAPIAPKVTTTSMRSESDLSPLSCLAMLASQANQLPTENPNNANIDPATVKVANIESDNIKIPQKSKTKPIILEKPKNIHQPIHNVPSTNPSLYSTQVMSYSSQITKPSGSIQVLKPIQPFHQVNIENENNNEGERKTSKIADIINQPEKEIKSNKYNKSDTIFQKTIKEENYKNDTQSVINSAVNENDVEMNTGGDDVIPNPSFSSVAVSGELNNNKDKVSEIAENKMGSKSYPNTTNRKSKYDFISERNKEGSITNEQEERKKQKIELDKEDFKKSLINSLKNSFEIIKDEVNAEYGENPRTKSASSKIDLNNLIIPETSKNLPSNSNMTNRNYNNNSSIKSNVKIEYDVASSDTNNNVLSKNPLNNITKYMDLEPRPMSAPANLERSSMSDTDNDEMDSDSKEKTSETNSLISKKSLSQTNFQMINTKDFNLKKKSNKAFYKSTENKKIVPSKRKKIDDSENEFITSKKETSNILEKKFSESIKNC